MWAERTSGRSAYVLKMYPRFSETFIVSEILAREAAGEDLIIFSLRPTTDSRFHPELARVKSQVIHVNRPSSARGFWQNWQEAKHLQPGLSGALPDLLEAGHDDAVQAVEVARLALEHGVDHLHAHFASVATTVARLASRITGIPYSFTTHAKDIFHESVRHEDLRTKARDAHHVVAISEFNRSFLERTLGPEVAEKIVLVRNGLELERFAFAPRQTVRSRPRLVSVGRLVEKKGFVPLLESLALIRAKGVDAVLDIVGDGPEKATIEDTIVRLGLEESVTLRGPMTQSEVRTLLYDHDLFVAPFVVAEDGNVDGLPTVLLEAMACGIPCVAGAVTAVPEVVRPGETGWLVDGSQPAEIAAAVVDALKSPHRAAVVEAARRLIVAAYDSHKQARRLQEIQVEDIVSATAATAQMREMEVSR